MTRKIEQRENLQAMNDELHVLAVEQGKDSYTDVFGNEVSLNKREIDTSWL